MKRKPKPIAQEDWDAVESPPLSNDMLSRMKPVKEIHPDIPPRVRGTQKAPLKVPVSIRLSPEVVNFFKAQGKGWQTKINHILHEYIKTHNEV